MRHHKKGNIFKDVGAAARVYRYITADRQPVQRRLLPALCLAWAALLPGQGSANAPVTPALELPSSAGTRVATQPPSQQLQRYRTQYSLALKLLQKGDFEAFDALLPGLEGYSLYPYLSYQRMAGDLSKLDGASFDAFTSTYSNTPLPRQLRNRWLKYLADNQRWGDFLAHYSEPGTSTTLKCHKGWALHQTGHPQQAYREARALWLVGHSQPKACDKLFDQLIKSGGVQQQHAWQRFWLALEKGNPSLARYVTRFIDDPQLQQATSQALDLHKRPARLAQSSLSPQQPGYTPLVTHTLKRLVRSDADQALQLWQKLAPTLDLTPEQHDQLEQRLGMRLLQNYHPRSAHWLDQIDPKFEDAKLLEWRLRYHLSQLDWTSVGKLLDQLSADEQLNDRWRYWRGRVLEHYGDRQQAVKLFTELSAERSFYGFLAAQRLGRSYSLNNSSGPLESQQLQALAALPGIERAGELFYHQQLTEARREWWQASRDFSAAEHYHAGSLARQWGWHTQAIRSAISARQWNDLKLRFPAPYSQSIASNAKRFDIDNQWIFAVARQESAFSASVRSRAGAVGLMQLMPGTARQTARSIKLKYRGSQQLKIPSTNIELGSAYLAEMLKRYNGNRVYATAAYNAGPRRVQGWLQQRGNLPVDLWIETIPFNETRQYVQNVLSFAVIYGDLLGQNQQFLKANEIDQLPPIN